MDNLEKQATLATKQELAMKIQLSNEGKKSGLGSRVTRRCHQWSLLENLSSPRVLVGFMLLNLYISVQCFVDCCLLLYPFSFGHCVVCSRCVVCSISINGLWLPLWYLQTFLKPKENELRSMKAQIFEEDWVYLFASIDIFTFNHIEDTRLNRVEKPGQLNDL